MAGDRPSGEASQLEPTGSGEEEDSEGETQLANVVRSLMKSWKDFRGVIKIFDLLHSMIFDLK